MTGRLALLVLTAVVTLAAIVATGYAWTRDGSGDHAEQDPVERGSALFYSKGCVGCHSIQDKGITPDFAPGPDLSDIQTTAADRVTGQSARKYILDSIVNPEAYVVPGWSGVFVRMPRTPMTSAEAGALVDYLLSDDS